MGRGLVQRHFATLGFFAPRYCAAAFIRQPLRVSPSLCAARSMVSSMLVGIVMFTRWALLTCSNSTYTLAHVAPLNASPVVRR